MRTDSNLAQRLAPAFRCFIAVFSLVLQNLSADRHPHRRSL